jgi:hypothetical protein
METQEKTYKARRTWEEGVEYYNIEYSPTSHTIKYLRLTYMEHAAQFIDLLHEAGYTEIEGDN